MANELKRDNFDQILKEQSVVMADFWAPWCGPCRMVGPFVDEIAQDFEGRAFVGKVNVDDEPELAARFGISTIPAILVFKGGQVVEKAIGARNKAALSQMIEKHL